MDVLLEKSENKLFGLNKSIDVQFELLKQILLKNEKLNRILEILSNSELKDYYVAAGCINQTVFNYYHDYDLEFGIGDIDIVYFDSDLSYEKEDRIICYVSDLLKDIPVQLDIKNEARVHLWYKDKYGKEIDPYISVEDAISSWGTSITCIGVRLENDKLVICAPYGLDDLFSMTIRPVKRQFTEDQYKIKTTKWKSKWPKLTIMPWGD